MISHEAGHDVKMSRRIGVGPTLRKRKTHGQIEGLSVEIGCLLSVPDLQHMSCGVKHDRIYFNCCNARPRCCRQNAVYYLNATKLQLRIDRYFRVRSNNHAPTKPCILLKDMCRIETVCLPQCTIASRACTLYQIQPAKRNHFIQTSIG